MIELLWLWWWWWIHAFANVFSFLYHWKMVLYRFILQIIEQNDVDIKMEIICVCVCVMPLLTLAHTHIWRWLMVLFVVISRLSWYVYTIECVSGKNRLADNCRNRTNVNMENGGTFALIWFCRCFFLSFFHSHNNFFFVFVVVFFSWILILHHKLDKRYTIWFRTNTPFSISKALNMEKKNGKGSSRKSRLKMKRSTSGPSLSERIFFFFWKSFIFRSHFTLVFFVSLLLSPLIVSAVTGN